jgi:hypothetical protein
VLAYWQKTQMPISLEWVLARFPDRRMRKIREDGITKHSMDGGTIHMGMKQGCQFRKQPMK